MDELSRLAGGGDEVEPAPRDEAVLIQAENAVGDGVAMVMIVKEPTVDVLSCSGRACFAKRGLYGVEIHEDMVSERAYRNHSAEPGKTAS